MSDREQHNETDWQLVEELYLAAVNPAIKSAYLRSSDTDKHAILVEFVKRQAITSKRWAQLLRNASASTSVPKSASSRAVKK